MVAPLKFTHTHNLSRIFASTRKEMHYFLQGYFPLTFEYFHSKFNKITFYPISGKRDGMGTQLARNCLLCIFFSFLFFLHNVFVSHAPHFLKKIKRNKRKTFAYPAHSVRVGGLKVGENTVNRKKGHMNEIIKKK